MAFHTAPTDENRRRHPNSSAPNQPGRAHPQPTPQPGRRQPNSAISLLSGATAGHRCTRYGTSKTTQQTRKRLLALQRVRRRPQPPRLSVQPKTQPAADQHRQHNKTARNRKETARKSESIPGLPARQQHRGLTRSRHPPVQEHPSGVRRYRRSFTAAALASSNTEP